MKQLAPSNLKGYWRLNETSGSTASDSSGLAEHVAINKSNNQIVQGLSGATPFAGNPLTGMNFLGAVTGDYVGTWPASGYTQNAISDFAFIVQTVTYTFSIWAKPNGAMFPSAANRTLFSNANGIAGQQQGLNFSIASTYPVDGWYLAGYSGGIILPGSSVHLNEWQHVAFRVRGTGLTGNVWVNGVKYGSGGIAGTLDNAFTAFPALQSSWPMYIGKLVNVAGYDWAGGLSDFAIWDTALTDTQIAALYDGGTNRCY